MKRSQVVAELDSLGLNLNDDDSHDVSTSESNDRTLRVLDDSSICVLQSGGSAYFEPSDSATDYAQTSDSMNSDCASCDSVTSDSDGGQFKQNHKLKRRSKTSDNRKVTAVCWKFYELVRKLFFVEICSQVKLKKNSLKER